MGASRLKPCLRESQPWKNLLLIAPRGRQPQTVAEGAILSAILRSRFDLAAGVRVEALMGVPAVRREELKLYFDYKSPFAFLAVEPAFTLPERFAVELRWIPFILRIKGKGDRSQYSEWKAQYSYMDARRWANKRGGFPIKGPLKVYDSSPALIGGLYASHKGFFRAYTEEVYARFFKRELEIDVPEQIAGVITELGYPADDFRRYIAGEGVDDLDACLAEAQRDHVFGVPLFVFRGEQFWGHDRIALLEERLTECGLRLR